MALTAAQRAEIQYYRAKASLTSDEETRLRELESIEEGRGKSAERRVADLKESIELLTEEISLNEAIKGLGETVVGLGAKKLEHEQALLDIAKEKIEIERKAGRLDEEKAAEQLAENARLQRTLGIRRQGYNEAENFAARWAGISRDPKHDFTKFLVDPEAFTAGKLMGLGEVIDGMSIMTSTVDKVVESSVRLAIEQDQAVANFRKATGASGEFDDNIRGLERSLYTAGVSTAEAGESIQTLFLNVTDFTEMSETQQKTLSETVAVLGELGVSAQTTAKNIQFATRVMGMSTTQAAKLQRELFTFAQDLGVSGDQMASDFASMGPQIAALGTNGVDAFRKLEVQAKNTGLQLSEILAIVEKFDKFDSAAQAVGRLNALLGGPYLNTLELVAETDPSKRFEILKDKVDAAGLSFDHMDYYQKKAIASAMGLNEQQLALMMRGRLDLIQEPQKSAAEIEALAEQTAQFNTIAEELAQTAKMLAISFGPLVSGLKLLFQRFQLLEPFMPIIGAAAVGLAFNFELLGMAQVKAFAPLAVAYLAYQGLVHIFGLTEEKAAAVAIIVGGALTIAMYSLAGGVTAATGGLNIVLAALSAIAVGVVVGFSPSVLFALGALTTAFFLLAPAILPLIPVLFPLALAISAVAIAAVGLAAAFTAIFGEGIVNNLQLMSVEIANIVASINELSATKALAFTTTMVATSTAAAAVALTSPGALSAAALTSPAERSAAVAGTAGGPAGAPAGGPAGAPAFVGPPPTININLSIDGKEFGTVVNSVEVSKYNSGKQSNLYDSVLRMMEQGLITGKHS